MKLDWQTPKLEVLDLRLTMAGPGIKNPDEFNDDPDDEEADHYS
ncbi:paeninodin family lasso peptide [Cytobacillus firmus]|nr:paeninodin family lasso peptide [Cytobacillus firmus]